MRENFYDILVEQITSEAKAELEQQIRAELEQQIRAELEAGFSAKPKLAATKSFAPPVTEATMLHTIETKRFTISKNPYPAPKISLKKSAPKKLTRKLNVEELLHYNIFLKLGAKLDEDFTEQDLKKQFRKLAWKFHPDRQIDLAPSEVKKCVALFESAKTSYDKLYKALEK